MTYRYIFNRRISNWTKNGGILDKYSSSHVAYWNMDEFEDGPGGTDLVNRQDSVGSNTATDVQYVLSGTGKNNNAAVFDVGVDYLWVADSPDICPTSGFVIDGWFKTSSNTLHMAFLTKGGAGVNVITIKHDGSAADKLAVITRQSNGVKKEVITNFTLVAGTFYYIAFIADSVAGKIYAYVDGVEKGTPVTYDSTLKTNTNNLDFGRFASGSLELDGTIDEVSFWKDIVFTSDAEREAFVAARYNSGNGSFYVTP